VVQTSRTRDHEVGVSDERQDGIAEIAAEAARHLGWLRDSGVGEIEPARPLAPLTPTRTSSPSPSPSPSPTTSPTPYALADKGCGSAELLAIRAELGDCTRCKLHGGRTKLVFGTGSPHAEVMFVGEGPGADEDREGEPFVGRAGQLLTKMIEAMGFRRDDVYIANVVKCRPPGNRNPEPDELEACEGFLRRQIAAVGPKVIVALGKYAAQTLLRDETPISRLRGRWAEYEGVRLMPTFHPAYLLRSPEEKKKAWEDLQLVMKELGVAPGRGLQPGSGAGPHGGRPLPRREG
jgi:uracil-DNA glycosylase